MILIFGGTTEGRVAAAVCDKAAKSYLYATKGADQRLVAQHAQQISGALNADDISQLIIERDVDLIIDAAHPYAEALHNNISTAAQKKSVPTIRFERMSLDIEYNNVTLFDSISQVVNHITRDSVSGVLALTGVKSAAAFATIANDHDVTLRIMDREDSLQQIEHAKFPAERVIYYELGADDNFDTSITNGLNINAIVTKESGTSGGFEKKVQLAKSLNIPLYIVRRPKLQSYTATIYGEHGLRREIERLLPHHYELRSGFTTGSAATAATVAALRRIITSQSCSSVEITLPNGEPFAIPIHCDTQIDLSSATATVIKDGGDDPDATHQIEIVARVTSLDSPSTAIQITGGEGVGTVTLPGIGIEVGESAINPVPLQMIQTNVEKLLNEYNIHRKIDIEISVPEGEKIGQKTFNPRLGIIGGISILGTSGIVQPFSAEAFIESIDRQIEVSNALGSDTIIINSGAMSERFLKVRYPDMLPQSYIHYGNLIGATIELAAKERINRVILGVMIGKAVKLAAGALDTHSKHVVLDRNFLSSIAKEANCTDEIIAQIEELTTARQLWTIIPNSHRNFFTLIKERCYKLCKALLPNGELEVVLISETGEIL